MGSTGNPSRSFGNVRYPTKRVNPSQTFASPMVTRPPSGRSAAFARCGSSVYIGGGLFLLILIIVVVILVVR
jgi:hypothetical protein